MDQVLRTLNFFVWGAQSNWWGLGCPSHCSSSSIPLLLLTFLLGLALGLLVWILGLFYLRFWWRACSSVRGSSHSALTTQSLRAWWRTRPLSFHWNSKSFLLQFVGGEDVYVGWYNALQGGGALCHPSFKRFCGGSAWMGFNSGSAGKNCLLFGSRRREP